MKYFEDYVSDKYGNGQSSVSITVKRNGATATIYSSRAGASKANPLTTESDGKLSFWYSGGGTYTFHTSDDTLLKSRVLDASPVNVLDYGAVGDGVTDDSAAIQAAVTAARYGVCIIPPGKYLASNIIAQNCEVVGYGGADSVTPYGVSGSVIYSTDTTNPVFKLGRGATLRNLIFYYPDQDGSTITDVSSYPTFTGAPITYPATIQTYHPSGAGASRIKILHCTAINAYDFIELGDGTHNVGRVQIDGCEGFALNRFLRVRKGTGLVQVSNTFASVAVFQSVAIVGDEELGKWAQRNATFMELNDTSGVHIKSGIAYGFRNGFVITGDKTSQSHVSGFLIDSTPIGLSVEGAGYLNTSSFANVTFYCLDRYDSSDDLAALTFAASPTLTSDNVVSFSGCSIQASQGDGISITTDCMRKFSWTGGRIAGWGSGTGLSSKSGMTRTDSAGVVQLVSTFFENTDTNGVGYNQTTGLKAYIIGCDFDSCYRPIQSTAGGTLVVTGCVGNASTIGPQMAATEVVSHHNRWNVNEAVVRHTRPAFHAKQASAQTFNSGTPAKVEFSSEVYDRGGDYDSSTYTFTARNSGEYAFSVSLGHDNTATAGDIWNIRIVTSNETFLNQYRVPAAAALSVSYSVVCGMEAGDTAYVDVALASGAGAFVTPADGTINRFMGRLVE